MTEFQPLAGKISLVTGATKGIGKGIALQLGQAGATVYITGEIYCLSFSPKLRFQPPGFANFTNVRQVIFHFNGFSHECLKFKSMSFNNSWNLTAG